MQRDKETKLDSNLLFFAKPFYWGKKWRIQPNETLAVLLGPINFLMRQDINEEMHQNFLKEIDMMFSFGLPSKWNLLIILHWCFKHKPCLEGRTTIYKLLHNSSSVKNTQASWWEASWEMNPIQHPFCANSKGFFCLLQHSSIRSLLLCLYSNSLKYCPQSLQAW